MTRGGMILVAALLLTGCATGTPLWITNDFDPARDPRRFERDRYECVREATYQAGAAWTVMPAGGLLLPVPLHAGGPEINQDLLRACMSSKGYTLVVR